MTPDIPAVTIVCDYLIKVVKQDQVGSVLIKAVKQDQEGVFLIETVK
jgi:hypothetical protein